MVANTIMYSVQIDSNTLYQGEEETNIWISYTKTIIYQLVCYHVTVGYTPTIQGPVLVAKFGLGSWCTCASTTGTIFGNQNPGTTFGRTDFCVTGNMISMPQLSLTINNFVHLASKETPSFLPLILLSGHPPDYYSTLHHHAIVMLTLRSASNY